MLRKIIKLCVYSALAYGIYYVFTLYILYTIAQTATIECDFKDFSDAGIQKLKARKASSLELEMLMHKSFSCLKEKQNPVQTFFFPVPENWINPPPGSITYDKLPYP